MPFSRVQVEVRQRGVGAERLGERCRPVVADAAELEPELLHRGVHLERLRQRLRALVSDSLVGMQVNLRHARVGLEDLSHRRRVVRRKALVGKADHRSAELGGDDCRRLLDGLGDRRVELLEAARHRLHEAVDRRLVLVPARLRLLGVDWPHSELGRHVDRADRVHLHEKGGAGFDGREDLENAEGAREIGLQIEVELRQHEADLLDNLPHAGEIEVATFFGLL